MALGMVSAYPIKKRKETYMIDVVHTVLTDTSIRSVETIEANLAETTSAGEPWFDAA